MWAWHKKFAEESEQKLKHVTALAVDPAGLKVACHGYSAAEHSNSMVGYIFVLDTSTGSVDSGLMKMTHAPQDFVARSAGFLLNNDGRVFMTRNVLGLGSEKDFPQLLSYDSVNNALGFSYKLTKHYGRVMSITRDEYSNFIYVAGN